MRIGYGYDSHRFDATRPLKLGGVLIPDAPGLKGHSDADALIHALIDALLGAAGLGDIGGYFPDDDARWKNADSADLLAAVVADVRKANWRLVNMDATVVCERPRLRSHVPAIRARLADLLDVPPSCVSVKGKTNEGMDDTGAGIGLSAHCAVLLESAAQGDA